MRFGRNTIDSIFQSFQTLPPDLLLLRTRTHRQASTHTKISFPTKLR